MRSETALPSFFIGEPEIKIPNSRQHRLIAVVEESEHQGQLDPIPHLIRWANARGYAAIANRHRYIGKNRCEFEVVLERQARADAREKRGET